MLEFTSRAEKSAKKILKSQPMNLSLWNVYAQLVLKLKGKDEASFNIWTESLKKSLTLLFPFS
jgi:hypothetical protein